MKKLYALAQVDNSFIVSARSEEELRLKLQEIRGKYKAYYKRFILPGIVLVRANSLREAKTSQTHKVISPPALSSIKKSA